MKKILVIILLSTLGAFAQSSTMLLLFGDDFEPETQLYLSSLTTPLSYDQQIRINTFVKMVKDSLQISSLSSRFDVMLPLANETAEAGLKNLVKRQHDATAVNSPTFTQWEGFTGNGTSSYLNTNYNDSTDDVNFKLDNNSFGFYKRTDGINTDMGIIGTGSQYTATRINAGNLTAGNYIVGIPTIAANGAGFWVVSRTANANFYGYKNAVGYLIPYQRTQPKYSLSFLICAGNTAGSAGLFSNAQISFAFIGEGLSNTEVNKLTNCIEWYMDDLGKGVIP